MQVRTREAFPEDWAMSQYNLATAYSDLTQKQLDNMGEDVGLTAKNLRSPLSDGILDVIEIPESSDTQPSTDSTEMT